MYKPLTCSAIRDPAMTIWSAPVKPWILFCLMSVLLLTHGRLVAAPTGGDLLEACTESVSRGFDSMIGQMCTWYVTPCDCNIDKSLPAVCLPESADTKSLSAIVISGLTTQPDLQQLDATRAAAMILSEEYPCPVPQLQ
jgi:hypothetical protein